MGLIFLISISTSLWSSDTVSGKIFKVDVQKRSFEILKETEYDPKTDIGQSRFTFHWTDKTTFSKEEKPTNPKGAPRQQPIQANELANGFWQATLVVHDDNGQTIVDNIRATPLPDPRKTDDPKLPRVLVIGDSISMNYHQAAKSALAGIANYHRNEGNASSSAQGVRNMELWLGNYQEKGFHWDVIQFNHGLHDLKQPYDAKTDKWGDYTVSLTAYKANLEKEISILKKTGAKLIWCATTPVPNDNKSTYARRKGASKIFNDAALEVIRSHPEILITDLHAIVEGSLLFDNWRKGIDVHFYQKEEQRILGEAVATTVRKALEKPVK